MGQGQKISSEMQQAIIWLSRVLNIDQITISLNLSTHSIRQVLSHFQTHGTIPNAEEQPAQDDCKGNRHLQDIDIKKAPDLYLDELKEMLAVSCGVDVLRTTVWHTLHRAGFTMKKITRVAAERLAQK
ncbi:hypothetical protein BS17DRAFT_882564 [Gyrodon lividus]|nr:hypothetical protein BS17DRAFT_882564 [Gyrodon lividus]